MSTKKNRTRRRSGRKRRISAISSKNNLKWTKLAKLSKKKLRIMSQLVLLNNYQMMVILSWEHEEDESYYYIYNINTNKWSKLKYADNFSPRFNNIAFDKATNTLYSSGITDYLSIIDLKKNKLIANLTDKVIPYIGSCSSILLINGNCHLIGGVYSNKHCILNSKTYEIEQIYEFIEWNTGFCPRGLIYVKIIK